MGYSPRGHKESDTTERLTLTVTGRFGETGTPRIKKRAEGECCEETAVEEADNSGVVFSVFSRSIVDL